MPQVTATCGWRRCLGETWLGSVGGAEFLFVFAKERGCTHFLGFTCFLGRKKGRRTRFPGHWSAICQVVQVENMQELERTVRLSFPRWRGMAGLVVQMDSRKRLTWVGARWSLCILSCESVENSKAEHENVRRRYCGPPQVMKTFVWDGRDLSLYYIAGVSANTYVSSLQYLPDWQNVSSNLCWQKRLPTDNCFA